MVKLNLKEIFVNRFQKFTWKHLPSHKDLFLCFLSGVLFSSTFHSLNFLPQWFRYFNFILLSPLFFSLMNLNKIHKTKVRIFHFIVLVFIFSFPLEIIGFTWIFTSIKYFFGYSNILTSLVYFLICSLSCIYYLFLLSPFFIFSQFKKDKYFKIIYLFLISILMATLEHIYPRLSNWYFGYSFYYNINLSQIASILGSYGLSFILFYSNLSFSFLFYTKKNLSSILYKKSYINLGIFSSFIIILNIISPYIFINNDNKFIKIGYIQPNFTVIQINNDLTYEQDKKQENLEKLLINLDNPKLDLIILPESAIYYQYGFSPEKMTDIINISKKLQTPILLQSVLPSYSKNNLRFKNKYSEIIEIEAAESKSFVIYPNGNTSNFYTKWKLMPLGEELPFSHLFPKIADKYLIETKQTIKLLNGNKANPLNFKNYKIGIFICYDSIDDSLSNLLSQNGAQFFVNQSNFLWMAKSNATFVFSIINQFKAIETNKSLLFLTNNGPTLLFNKNGEIIFNNKTIFSQNIGYLEIPVNQDISFYSKYFLEIKYIFVFISTIGLILFFRKLI
jgi:apolipoprotein N-acyltransferase